MLIWISYYYVGSYISITGPIAKKQIGGYNKSVLIDVSLIYNFWFQIIIFIIITIDKIYQFINVYKSEHN